MLDKKRDKKMKEEAEMLKVVLEDSKIEPN
jgi:hypothetical protein